MDDWDDPLDEQTADAGAGAGSAATGDEEAVRRYLTWIADPASLRDEDRIRELHAQIDAATDPIEKIRLASDLHRAQTDDGTDVRDAFAAVARRWADANGIVPEAFLQMGVPADDLGRAGFDVPRRTGRRNETGTVAGSRSRARRVSIDEIRDAARAFTEPFTIADLRDRVGGSPATVRKALDALVADGAIENLGSDPDWSGRGRPPARYLPRPR